MERAAWRLERLGLYLRCPLRYKLAVGEKKKPVYTTWELLRDCMWAAMRRFLQGTQREAERMEMLAEFEALATRSIIKVDAWSYYKPESIIAEGKRYLLAFAQVEAPVIQATAFDKRVEKKVDLSELSEEVAEKEVVSLEVKVPVVEKAQLGFLKLSPHAVNARSIRGNLGLVMAAALTGTRNTWTLGFNRSKGTVERRPYAVTPADVSRGAALVHYALKGIEIEHFPPLAMDDYHCTAALCRWWGHCRGKK